MNRYHRRLCKSPGWAAYVAETLLPAVVGELSLGSRVLELGPGYGASTRPLVSGTESLTVIEPDALLAAGLRAELGAAVRVIDGDATGMAFEAASFSAVVCFTMLHHLQSPAEQDKLFAEAARVLAPGGVFAGADSRQSRRFRLIHLGDTCTPVDPETLPGRLARAGFTRIGVHADPRVLRFAAYAPAGIPVRRRPAVP